MSRTYIIPASKITIAAASTLIFLRPGTTASLQLLWFEIGQENNATSAQERICLSTQVSAFPTLVSQTPQKTRDSDPVSLIVGGTAGAAGTCGINASAEGAGAKTLIYSAAFNTLVGHRFTPGPLDKFILSASSANGWALHFADAPANLADWTANLCFLEL